VCLEDSHLAQFVKLGVLADITSKVKPYVSKILDYKWQQASAGGHYYAMPWDAGPLALFYRRSVFKRAHVDPTSIHTWSDYYKAGLKIKKLGVAMWIQSKGQNDARFFESLLWQQGSGYINAKGDVSLDKDPRALAAAQSDGQDVEVGDHLGSARMDRPLVQDNQRRQGRDPANGRLDGDVPEELARSENGRRLGSDPSAGVHTDRVA